MPSSRLTSKVARLLALQMFVIALGIIAIYAFVLFHTRPNQSTEMGGIDLINTTIVWIAFTAICGALIYLHVNFGRQLLSESKGTRRGIKSW